MGNSENFPGKGEVRVSQIAHSATHIGNWKKHFLLLSSSNINSDFREIKKIEKQFIIINILGFPIIIKTTTTTKFHSFSQPINMRKYKELKNIMTQAPTDKIILKKNDT